MSYVYISDITPDASSASAQTPAPPATPQQTAAALDANAKALELTAKATAAVSPGAAAGLQAQADALKMQADAIRAQYSGLSMPAKAGIVLALAGAAGGAYWYATRPKMRMNRKRR